jgi:WhiB family redox-sensing transcriptional regulator
VPRLGCCYDARLMATPRCPASAARQGPEAPPLDRLRAHTRHRLDGDVAVLLAELTPTDPGLQPAGRQSAAAMTDRSVMNALSWMLRGACCDDDPWLFFPLSESGSSLRQIERARALCGRRPVLAGCLRYVMDTHQHGIWGATTDDERRCGSRHGGMPRAA